MPSSSAGSGVGEPDPVDPGGGRIGLGPALRRAWVGYQVRLNQEMAAAGFEDRGLPDGRVLRICSRSAGITTSQIGRDLGISRQGAAKIVAKLVDRQYVTLSDSPTSGREKLVRVTPRATAYLEAQRQAARSIESQLRTEIGPEALESLYLVLESLAGDDELPRLWDYLRQVMDP